MNIPGDYEDRKITPAVWEFFEDFWGDKAYRQAEFVEGFEALVRGLVAGEGDRLVIDGTSHGVVEMELHTRVEDWYGYLVWVGREHTEEDE